MLPHNSLGRATELWLRWPAPTDLAVGSSMAGSYKARIWLEDRRRENSPLCLVNPKRPIGLKWFSACGSWLEIMWGGFPAPSPSDCLWSLWDEATQTPPAKQTLRHTGASNYIQYVDSVTTLYFLSGTLRSSKKTQQKQTLSFHSPSNEDMSCFFTSLSHPPALLVHFYPCLIKAS